MKTTLVIGASKNPARYSNKAIISLLEKGHPVKAIGLRPETVHGVQVDTDLYPYHGIHTVTLYIGPQNQDEYFDYLVSLKPQRVIFNPGTENNDLADVLASHDIEVDYACTLVLLANGLY